MKAARWIAAGAGLAAVGAIAAITQARQTEEPDYRLVRADGVGVLFTEHDMDVVFGHATRVLVLNRGQLIAHGSPAEVRANEAVREVYLGSGAMYGEAS